MSFDWLTPDSLQFLQNGYLEDGEDAQTRIRQICDAAEKILKIQGFSDKFYDYLGRGFYSLQSPVWANFGKVRGLPISCNGSYIPDDMADIMEKLGEVAIQTKQGAGTSGYFSHIRPRGSEITTGGKADGPVHFMNMFETTTNVVQQGQVRRGSFAAYMDVEHPDIEEFLELREVGHYIQKMSMGVCISDQWMTDMIMEGEAVKAKTMKASDAKKAALWAKILRKRKETGYPYIFFTDTVNNGRPQVLKDKGYKVYASNLCVTGDTEIFVTYPKHKEDGGITIVMEKMSITDFVDLYTNASVIDRQFHFKVATDDGFKKVTNAGHTGYTEDLVIITTESGKTVTVTPMHEVYTTHGKIAAEKLHVGDVVRTSNGEDKISKIEHFKSINETDDGTFVKTPVYDISVDDIHRFFANGILVSNCSEICLPSSTEWSFVCNLASMNILKWDEWKDTDAVETLTFFLDAVMEEYIEKTKNMRFMEASRNFAQTWRALGIGQLGWHSYLQSKMIAFESFDAISLTSRISKFIAEKSYEASRELAKMFGEPSGMVGYGMRNLTTMAIAPTTSSQFILGAVSPSIEPLAANYFVKNLAKGSFTYRNPYLQKVLEAHGKDTDEVWDTILDNYGSVQHLDFLSDHERDVFKTFAEITPMTIIQQAAARQKWIDQSQSLNLMIPPDAPMKDVSTLLIEAWKMGVKTIYYNRSTGNAAQKLVKDILSCASCEA